jgi:two-component system, NarL family, nitrate/nitrite response regulator NarL
MLLGHSSASPFGQIVAAPAVNQPKASDPLGEPEQLSQLSSRETAILSSLVRGAANKVIANQLKITEATVKVHIKAILRKIRVKNRTQAAIWAMQHQSLPMHYTQATANWTSSDEFHEVAPSV